MTATNMRPTNGITAPNGTVSRSPLGRSAAFMLGYIAVRVFESIGQVFDEVAVDFQAIDGKAFQVAQR